MTRYNIGVLYSTSCALRHKCTGLSGRVYDMIVDKTKGLSWSCERCRQSEINFQNLLLQTRADFHNIMNNMNVIF